MNKRQAKKKYKEFAKFVADEIFDEYWEFNKEAFAEIACRKLCQLGIVKSKDGEWIYRGDKERTNE